MPVKWYWDKIQTMKHTALIFLTLICFACRNKKSFSFLDDQSQVLASTIAQPKVKFGVEGFYTGRYGAEKREGNKKAYDKKITICIDSLNESKLFGHSIIGGTDRPFSGPYKKMGKLYEVSASEPGDNRYDGNFIFTIDAPHHLLKGNWSANNTNLSVLKSEFELKEKPYKYESALRLPDLFSGLPLFDSKEEDKYETLTEDVLKFNPSITLLKSADIEKMYHADLEVLRNSIYARHGFSFLNKRMRILFDNVNWYMPVTTNVTPLLTEVEKKNIVLIKRYEANAEKYYEAFSR
jgi:hypothetical protein